MVRSPRTRRSSLRQVGGGPDRGPCDYRPPADDDDVVFLLPPTFTSAFPVWRPPCRAARSPCGSGCSAATASRPGRRLALLDGQGGEVDTRTATDGGGGVRDAHSGRS